MAVDIDVGRLAYAVIGAGGGPIFGRLVVAWLRRSNSPWESADRIAFFVLSVGWTMAVYLIRFLWATSS
jgi:hypothetical protein